MEKLAVVAIGGNSLIKDSKRQRVEDQYEAIVETAGHIADLAQAGYNLLISHGNGPQVGFILQRSEIAYEQAGLHFVPLVSCVADTQGAIGYQIQQALSNIFKQRQIRRQVVSVVTQVRVDADDPAFKRPDKPIGSFYTEAQIDEHKTSHPDWTFMPDAGRGYRRCVPSPRPLEIIEMDAIATLLQQRFCVVAVGGGGIPVVTVGNGGLAGVDAVIDKDYATALLATNLGADLLIISTSVEKVCLNFGTEQQTPLDRMSVDQARQYITEKQFAAGSMLPKIEAALNFLEHGGSRAIITAPQFLKAAVEGKKGTTITPEKD